MIAGKDSFSRLLFRTVNATLLIALGVACLLPLLHVIMASFSEPAKTLAYGGFILWPLGKPTLNGYKILLQYKNVWSGYANTLFYIVAQCLITGTLVFVASYVVTRKRLRYRNAMMAFMMFTMLFNGGMIPSYMVVRYLGLLDTYGAMLIPSAIGVFFIIILKTAIQGIPESLEESARIDGASAFTIMFRILLPLTKATFAVILLFVAVGKWNEWFSALIYLPTAKDKYPLQMFMREILIRNNDISNPNEVANNMQTYKTLVKYCAIVASTLPILLIYPFVQKYFVQGVMIGSIKG